MPASTESVTHPLLGKIHITRNSKAQHIIMRVCNGEVHVTMPICATVNDLEKALEKHKVKLREHIEQNSRKHIGYDFCIDAPHFKFNLQTTHGELFQLMKKGITYTLLCPVGRDIDTPQQQEWLRKVIITALRDRARELLPPRLLQLAAREGFSYGKISIRDTHTRWGSCNAVKNISLSIYLALLPNHLIDYVIMHELCHTIEMNHSPRFWKLLDEKLACNAKLLRRELHSFRYNF